MNEIYNQTKRWKATLSTMMNLSSGVILLILCCSFNSENASNSLINPEQYKGINPNHSEPYNQLFTYDLADNLRTKYLFDLGVEGHSSHFLPEMVQSFIDSSGIQSVDSGYFHKVYYGNGLDHMNINLVNISLSGLKPGDEIGVFDGNYCVGSSLIEKEDLKKNNLSIPASANDTIESSPNGYIEGHNITLQAYRNGVVYQLYFQLVNNSQDIFERRASMFAFVNFSKSPAIIEP